MVPERLCKTVNVDAQNLKQQSNNVTHFPFNTKFVRTFCLGVGHNVLSYSTHFKPTNYIMFDQNHKTMCTSILYSSTAHDNMNQYNPVNF